MGFNSALKGLNWVSLWFMVFYNFVGDVFQNTKEAGLS